MKKLLLIVLAILSMAVIGQAAITQTIAVVETTTSSMIIEDDYGIDGDVKKIILFWGTGINLGWSDLSRKDSILQTNTPSEPDSFKVTRLKHNTYYSFAIVMQDSVDAHADSIHYDTTGIYTVKTEGITITNTAEDITYRSFQIHLELANVDSAAKKIVLEYRIPSASYARMDSAVSINNNDDSLVTPVAPTDLQRATYYDARVIVTDSTGTDTSAVTRVLTLNYDWGTWYQPLGWNESHNLYHVTYSWTNSGNTMVVPIDISPFEWVKVWVRLFGLDNNETNDSAYVFLSSYANGAQVFGDTLIAADVDTGRAAEAWFLKPQVSNETDTLVGAWGTDLRLNLTSSSGDTTTVDTRYLDAWLMFK